MPGALVLCLRAVLAIAVALAAVRAEPRIQASAPESIEQADERPEALAAAGQRPDHRGLRGDAGRRPTDRGVHLPAGEPVSGQRATVVLCTTTAPAAPAPLPASTGARSLERSRGPPV